LAVLLANGRSREISSTSSQGFRLEFGIAFAARAARRPARYYVLVARRWGIGRRGVRAGPQLRPGPPTIADQSWCETARCTTKRSRLAVHKRRGSRSHVHGPSRPSRGAGDRRSQVS